MKELSVAVIGLGARGYGVLDYLLVPCFKDVRIAAVCDVYEDRVKKGQERCVADGRPEPFGSTDYREVLKQPDLDAVLIYTSWDSHAEIAIAAMKAGVAVGSEVGCEYSLENCWDLVRTQEETGVSYMFLENCCYSREELYVTAMARKGVFGEIVHCEGAYGHDLRSEVAGGIQNRHYRFRNYVNRNCENYPTHELGPIAKLLGINRGNRILTVSSFASKAAGMKAYVKDHAERLSLPDEVVGAEWKQGDIIKTILTCAGGETIVLTLDTTLPRLYSRDFTVLGTHGRYNQVTNSVVLNETHDQIENAAEAVDFTRAVFNNGADYEKDYLPKLWRDVTPEMLKAGHGGMDYFAHKAFFDALRDGSPMPIDVYDGATWMAVSVLSEQSIAMGGVPQAMPDFTGGAWLSRPLCDVTELA